MISVTLIREFRILKIYNIIYSRKIRKTFFFFYNFLQRRRKIGSHLDDWLGTLSVNYTSIVKMSLFEKFERASRTTNRLSERKLDSPFDLDRYKNLSNDRSRNHCHDCYENSRSSFVNFIPKILSIFFPASCFASNPNRRELS